MTERCTRIVHKALAAVRPQFRLHFEGGIHGLPHWSRVWFHGRALAASQDVDPAVLACWDADRLDLARVGIRPRADRLCTAHARSDGVIRDAVRMAEGRARQARRRGSP